MNKEQRKFLRAYLRTGDKIAAYRQAYPNAKETTLKSAANRLLRTNPQIAAAVQAKEDALDKQAEAEVLEQKRRKHAAKNRVRELLADVIEGREQNVKLYKTRDGYDRQTVPPTVSQKLAAANAVIRLEGWAKLARPARAAEKKAAQPQQPAEPQKIKCSIGGLPMDEYGKLHSATINAYFDPEDGSSKWWPLHIMGDKFADLQKRREARKDAERQQRTTPQLQHEEAQALREYETRTQQEDQYKEQSTVIDNLRSQYLGTKDPGKLKELQAVQKMCGLRFLHHRHRYEAEREAGWYFHPHNNNLITTSPKRQQAETIQGTNPKSPAPNPKSPIPNPKQQNPNQTSNIQNHQSPITNTKGYTHIKELLQDEHDYYIRNQGSITYRQMNDLERFAKHRNASPEIRKQIEQQTGWLYHPTDTAYARRNPSHPLVRTIFKGP